MFYVLALSISFSSSSSSSSSSSTTTTTRHSLGSLGPLVKKIKDSQIEVVINALCSNMFSDSERLRDISRCAPIKQVRMIH